MDPWLAALATLTVLRLLVAALSPLSPDEAYYWTWSHALAPGYLDHPPMTALWIHAGTLVLGDTPIGVRLLAPLAAALGTLLLTVAGQDLLGGGQLDRPHLRAAGLRAAVLLNATLLVGVGAVTITPDTPLLFFWTAALAALGRLVATRRGVWWLPAGLAIGLALDSKYTAVLPAAGLGLWLLATGEGRRWARTPWPWAAAVIALLLFSPVLGWNAAHGWASFLKQGGRTGAWRPWDAGRYLAELLGGQIGLVTPFVFILFVWGIARLVRPPATVSPDHGLTGHRVLIWVTVPAALVFIQHAFGDRVQANWPGLLYPACAIAAASLSTRWWKAASALGMAMTLLVYMQAVAAPLRLPGRLDITLVRLAGWPALAGQVAARAAADGGVDRFIAADEYGLAAELAFALPRQTVLAVEPRWRLFAMPHPDKAGETGLLLRSARRKDAPDATLFGTCLPLGELQRARGLQRAEFYQLYRVTLRPDLTPGLRAQIASLPSPRR